MAEYCSCMGGYTDMLSHSVFMEQLNTFRNIARWVGPAECGCGSLNILFQANPRLIDLS